MAMYNLNFQAIIIERPQEVYGNTIDRNYL